MPLLVRTLTDGGAGMRAQAEGLAGALAEVLAAEVAHSRVSGPAWAGLLPLSAASSLLHTEQRHGDTRPADIVICCGTRSHAPALAMARRQNAFAVCIQRPSARQRMFDALVAPRHDYSPAEIRAIEADADSSIVLTTGSVGRINAQTLADVYHPARKQFFSMPTPRVGVVFGGSNRAYSLTPQHCRPLARSIAVAAGGAGLLVTISRRTEPACVQVLAEEFSGPNCFFYDGHGPDNPYRHILSAADFLLVSGDSVNMLSEACSAQKPVYILPLLRDSARAASKFERFHRELLAKNLARFWGGNLGKWPAPGLEETARAADKIRRLYRRTRPQPS